MTIADQKQDAVRGILAHLESGSKPIRNTKVKQARMRRRARVIEALLKMSLDTLDCLFNMCLERAQVRHPVFVAKAEDITNVGGPMGSETTYTIFRKYYYSTTKAKQACQEHYGDKPIMWTQSRTGNYITSGDLGHVMYYIKKVEVNQ